jgi:serine/threonine-protein kinase
VRDLRIALADALGPVYRVEREVRPVDDRRLFIATELPDGPELLIKVLPGALSLALDERKFEREALLLADRLHHPRLVAPRGTGRAGANLFYTRRFIDGTTLRSWIARNGALPLARAVEFLTDILAALAHAHGERIAHGELRSENVLVTEHHAMVADAGMNGALARAHAVGDPGRPSDPRDDMLAVGVLAHEMLTGKPPAPEGEPLTETRSLPDWLEHLVDRCLADDPATRWADAREALASVPPRP